MLIFFVSELVMCFWWKHIHIHVALSSKKDITAFTGFHNSCQKNGDGWCELSTWSQPVGKLISVCLRTSRQWLDLLCSASPVYRHLLRRVCGFTGASTRCCVHGQRCTKPKCLAKVNGLQCQGSLNFCVILAVTKIILWHCSVGQHWVDAASVCAGCFWMLYIC